MATRAAKMVYMSGVFSDTDRTINIEGVEVHLAHPDKLPIKWVGQAELLRHLQAAWLTIDPDDVPMTPRLLGKPGVGKTTLAYAGAMSLHREAYIMQAERLTHLKFKKSLTLLVNTGSKGTLKPWKIRWMS